MKDIFESLAVILIILLVLIGPILLISAILGGIFLSVFNPIISRIGWNATDLQLNGWRRVLVGVIGVILWGVVWTIAFFVLCAAYPGLPVCPIEPTPTEIILAASTNTDLLTATPTPTPTFTPPPTSTPTAAATNTPASTPISCVCQFATDDDTFRCLIHTEAEAVNNADLTLIQEIFAPDATIYRGDTEEEWKNPIAYYGPAFDSLDYSDAKHFDIHQVEIVTNSARYTSGSSGYYTMPGATPTPYFHENPSEHWIFGKNDQGCWVIKRFEFNASHVEFP